MKLFSANKIRNIAVIGHSGSGKTMFAEAAILQPGTISRLGSLEEKNTVSDYHELEHEKQHSVYSSLMSIEYKDTKLNIIDVPGFSDYVGQMVNSVRVCDSSLIFINGHNGLEVGTELGWSNSKKENNATAFCINKLDSECDFNSLVNEIKTQFGANATILQYPLNSGEGFDSIIDLLSNKLHKYSNGKLEILDIPDSEKDVAENYRNELIESIAESDEDLMNKYFEDGDLSDEDMHNGIRKAMVAREIFPILCAAGGENVGVEGLLNFIVENFPSPFDMPVMETEDGRKVPCESNGPTSLFIYNMQSDARTGDLVFFRVCSGKVKHSDDLINSTNNNTERVGQLYTILGKNRTEIERLEAGDLGATVKLKVTHINDTLSQKGLDAKYKAIEYPNYKVRVAIEPKVKGEEEKVGLGLHHIHFEDPSVVIEHSSELRQILVFAQGDVHLQVVKKRLEMRYKVETIFIEPRVPYRETIQKMAKGSYRHKKQSGGAGQFAEVHMMIEPYYEEAPDPEGVSVRKRELNDLEWGGKLEFLNCIVGGVIDQRFLPAILKGVMEKMEIGPLTGSYVRDIRVIVHDGKMHPVDSNEAAFKMAGSHVFKDIFVDASPKLLEPIYNLKIRVPEDHVGDIMSDLPSRRGVILGIDTDGKYQVVDAKMPLSELDHYSAALRSLTQAKATFDASFDAYQSVPMNVQQELINKYNSVSNEE